MMDADNGKVLESFPISAGVDANIYDPATGLVFSSTRAGVLHVFHEDSADKLSPVEEIKTEYGAKTMGLDPSDAQLVSGHLGLYAPQRTEGRPQSHQGNGARTDLRALRNLAVHRNKTAASTLDAAAHSCRSVAQLFSIPLRRLQAGPVWVCFIGLRQLFISAYFRGLLFMMRNGNKIHIQFPDKEPGLGPETGRDSFHQFIMIGITLFENVEISIAGNVDSFHTLIES